MKKNIPILCIALLVVLSIALLVAVIARTFFPSVILPKLDIPNMVAISLIAHCISRLLCKETDHIVCIALFGVLGFGILPYVSGFVTGLQAWKLGLVGGVVFTVTSILYFSILSRLSTGPIAKAAPYLSALGLYLAAQCFAGWPII